MIHVPNPEEPLPFGPMDQARLDAYTGGCTCHALWLCLSLERAPAPVSIYNKVTL